MRLKDCNAFSTRFGEAAAAKKPLVDSSGDQGAGDECEAVLEEELLLAGANAATCLDGNNVLLGSPEDDLKAGGAKQFAPLLRPPELVPPENTTPQAGLLRAGDGLGKMVLPQPLGCSRNTLELG